MPLKLDIQITLPHNLNVSTCAILQMISVMYKGFASLWDVSISAKNNGETNHLLVVCKSSGGDQVDWIQAENLRHFLVECLHKFYYVETQYFCKHAFVWKDKEIIVTTAEDERIKRMAILARMDRDFKKYFGEQ